MNGVAEESFTGVLHHQAEECFNRKIIENHLSGLHFVENTVSGSAVLRSKNFAVSGFAPRVRCRDAQAVELLRRQLQLVTQFRGSISHKWTLHVPERTCCVGRVHLPIDKFGCSRFKCTGAKVVGRNKARYHRLDESPLFLSEKAGLVIAHGRCIRRFCGRAAISGRKCVHSETGTCHRHHGNQG
ncbi:hypothetical protein D3C84_851020 [compost metagenome]